MSSNEKTVRSTEWKLSMRWLLDLIRQQLAGISILNHSESQIHPVNRGIDSWILRTGSIRRERCAVLAADVVEYSILMERDDLDTVCRLRNLYCNVLVPAATAHFGRIVRVMGDGALVVFPDATSAISCAVEIQRAIRCLEGRIATPLELRLRIGVDIEDTLFVDGDIHGRGVIIAARLEALAEPGDILLSGNIYEEVNNSMQIRCEALGLRTVKHIAKPVNVYRIATRSSIMDSRD